MVLLMLILLCALWFLLLFTPIWILYPSVLLAILYFRWSMKIKQFSIPFSDCLFLVMLFLTDSLYCWYYIECYVMMLCISSLYPSLRLSIFLRYSYLHRVRAMPYRIISVVLVGFDVVSPIHSGTSQYNYIESVVTHTIWYLEWAVSHAKFQIILSYFIFTYCIIVPFRFIHRKFVIFNNDDVF